MADDLAYRIRVVKVGDLHDYWLAEPTHADGSLAFTPTTDRSKAAKFSLSMARTVCAAAAVGNEYRLTPFVVT